MSWQALQAVQFRHWRIFRSWCAGSALAKCCSWLRLGSDLLLSSHSIDFSSRGM